MAEALTIVPMTAEYGPAVLDIYGQGIESGQATLATTVPTWEEWDTGYLPGQRYVALDGNRVLGWAALRPSQDGCAFRGVAEDSVYVDETVRGRGVGRDLLRRLVASSEAANIWTLRAYLLPQNEASRLVHTRQGFRYKYTSEGVGELNGRLQDVDLFERRSRVTGPMLPQGSVKRGAISDSATKTVDGTVFAILPGDRYV